MLVATRLPESCCHIFGAYVLTWNCWLTGELHVRVLQGRRRVHGACPILRSACRGPLPPTAPPALVLCVRVVAPAGVRRRLGVLFIWLPAAGPVRLFLRPVTFAASVVKGPLGPPSPVSSKVVLQ